MYKFPTQPTEQDIVDLATHICEYEKALHAVATGTLLVEEDEMLLNLYLSSYADHKDLRDVDFIPDNFAKIALSVETVLWNEYEKATRLFEESGGELSGEAASSLVEANSIMEYLRKRLLAQDAITQVFSRKS